jgi:hypothetical protein
VDVPLPIRLFSLREANALVNTLNQEFAKARELRDELMGVQQKLEAEGPTSIQRLQGQAVRIIDKLRAILTEVAELGVEVKAADGLVDFRSKLHGRTVYLCWRYGEDHIGHFHELDTGFGGRRPLPDDGDFIGDLLQ